MIYRIALLAPLLGAFLIAGCASVEVSSKSEPNESLAGKKLVMQFVPHERFQHASDVMEKKLGAILAGKGVEAIPFTQKGLSLSDHAAMDFAKEKGADYLMIYALTGGTITGNGLTDLTSEGVIVKVSTGKPVWKGSLDYSRMVTLIGTMGTAINMILDKLVGKLEEDGFLPGAAAAVKAPA